MNDMSVKWDTVKGWEPAEGLEDEGGDEYDWSTSYTCIKIE
jgi:hypothetical protein